MEAHSNHCTMLSRSVVSNSLQPHGLQPARLLWPWGFSRQEYWSGLPCPPPGDFPSSGIKPRSPAFQADSLLSELPGKPKNTGVGSHAPFQGIFPTQGSNPGLLHWRQILYHLSYQGSPWILKWVDYPFARGSSRPRNGTRVSCLADGFFTNWAIRECPCGIYCHCKNTKLSSPWARDAFLYVGLL